ncbi:hypothetical protein GX51_07647 [Blastomyces parvus]|uniref:Uncharacterized protein n=1 Tax=Blastomyces parvus TaxID=2060905 RepID=A0A2B7WJM0_9EURO|nr:hypothetical protein GX51_07647 [Blastomyces parvus]
MIEWLRRDGYYLGLIGWSTEWDQCAIFGLPSSTPEPHVLGVPTSSAEKPDGQPQRESNVTEDIDGSVEMVANAEFPKALVESAHASYVKKMVKKHVNLLPDTLKEIDQRLLKARVTPQEVQSLTTGSMVEAHKKLARLDQAMRTCPRSTRLQFRPIYVFAPGKWRSFDITLPETYQLGDFEANMLCRVPVINRNKPKNPASIQGCPPPSVASQTIIKKPGFDKQVWAYKITERDQIDSEAKNSEGWKALCDEEDFTELKQALLKDDQKEDKIAIVCHEAAFEMMELEKEKQGKEVHGHNIGLENPSNNMGNDNSNMTVDDGIDWSQVINAKVAGWEED